MKNYNQKKLGRPIGRDNRKTLTKKNNSANIGVMNWIKRKLRNWVNDNRIDEPEPIGIGSLDRHQGLDENYHNPLRFTIYNAHGGKVVEVRTYDEKRDHWITSLHVIESDEDFGDSIGKIVFTESLKRGC